jgi:hypothetical protein
MRVGSREWLISMGWDYFSELLLLTDILFIPQMLWVGERRWNDMSGENLKTRRKTCPGVTFSTTNSTWIDPSANPGLRGEGRRLTAWAVARPAREWSPGNARADFSCKLREVDRFSFEVSCEFQFSTCMKQLHPHSRHWQWQLVFVMGDRVLCEVGTEHFKCYLSILYMSETWSLTLSEEQWGYLRTWCLGEYTYVDLRGMKWWESGENWILRSYANCTLHRILLGRCEWGM